MGTRYGCALLLLCVVWLGWDPAVAAEDTTFQVDPETEPPPPPEPKLPKKVLSETKPVLKKSKKQKKHKGYLMLGAGYTAQDGFLAQLRVAGRDLFGVEGLALSTSSYVSQNTIHADVYAGYDSRKRPWLIDLSLHMNQTNLSGGGWEEGLRLKDFGGQIRVGWKLGRGWRLLAGYRLAHQHIEQAEVLDKASDYVATPPGGWTRPRLLSAVRLQLEYTTPQRKNTKHEFHEGWQFLLGAEGSARALGSDYRYARFDARLRYGIHLPLGIHLALETKAGMFLGDNIPFSERYRLGGPTNGTSLMPVLGPQLAYGQGAINLGGQGMLHTRAILYIPIVRKIGLSLFTGVEAGVLLYKSSHPQERPWNVSWNGSAVVGLRWNSPIGPLNFGFGVPLLAPPGEPRQLMFSFGVGNNF